jgi:hypothetical protein
MPKYSNLSSCINLFGIYEIHSDTNTGNEIYEELYNLLQGFKKQYPNQPQNTNSAFLNFITQKNATKSVIDYFKTKSFSDEMWKNYYECNKERSSIKGPNSTF